MQNTNIDNTLCPKWAWRAESCQLQFITVRLSVQQSNRGHLQPPGCLHKRRDMYCLPTWQPPHGCRPRLFERDVPRQESGQAHEHTKRGIADTDVCLLSGHNRKKNNPNATHTAGHWVWTPARRDASLRGWNTGELLISKQQHPVNF